MYSLICMGFDGEYVIEKDGFTTVNDAWKHANNMGSRWYFYPFHMVTTASHKTVVNASYGLECVSGKRLNTVSKLFKKVSEYPALNLADVDNFIWAIQTELEHEEIQSRLDYLRKEIKAERISYGEIAELQDLAEFIPEDDILLREWAGIPEFEEGE